MNEKVREAGAFVEGLRTELEKVIVGQQYLLERLLVGLLADGHILIEGVPGLAKTLAVRTLSSAVRCEFKRIQFTPDLLPADLTGTMVFNPQANTFEPKKVRCLRIWCWPMKSTGRPPRCRALCWRRCRSAR